MILASLSVLCFGFAAATNTYANSHHKDDMLRALKTLKVENINYQKDISDLLASVNIGSLYNSIDPFSLVTTSLDNPVLLSEVLREMGAPGRDYLVHKQELHNASQQESFSKQFLFSTVSDNSASLALARSLLLNPGNPFKPANVNEKYRDFWPLLVAVLKNDESLFKELMEYKPDITLKYNNGMTVVHAACMVGFRGILKYDVLKKLIDERDNDGKTAFWYCNLHDYLDMTEALTGNFWKSFSDPNGEKEQLKQQVEELKAEISELNVAGVRMEEIFAKREKLLVEKDQELKGLQEMIGQLQDANAEILALAQDSVVAPASDPEDAAPMDPERSCVRWLSTLASTRGLPFYLKDVSSIAALQIKQVSASSTSTRCVDQEPQGLRLKTWSLEKEGTRGAIKVEVADARNGHCTLYSYNLDLQFVSQVNLSYLDQSNPLKEALEAQLLYFEENGYSANDVFNLTGAAVAVLADSIFAAAIKGQNMDMNQIATRLNYTIGPLGIDYHNTRPLVSACELKVRAKNSLPAPMFFLADKSAALQAH